MATIGNAGYCTSGFISRIETWISITLPDIIARNLSPVIVVEYFIVAGLIGIDGQVGITHHWEVEG